MLWWMIERTEVEKENCQFLRPHQISNIWFLFFLSSEFHVSVCESLCVHLKICMCLHIFCEMKTSVNGNTHMFWSTQGVLRTISDNDSSLPLWDRILFCLLLLCFCLIFPYVCARLADLRASGDFPLPKSYL